MRHRIALTLLLAGLAVSGCLLKPANPAGPTRDVERTIRGGLKPKAPARPADDFFGPADGGAGIIANNGGGIIANNAGSLVGTVKAPPGLLSNNGAGIISNNSGGYRVQAAALVALPDVEVQLVTADGKAVLDAEGQPVKAVTDAEGRYRMPFSGNTANLVNRVVLPEDKGALLAFVARGEGDREVDLDLNSTLVMGYILGQYVKGDQRILEKLPGEVEAETRRKMASAAAQGGLEAPSVLTSEAVARTVDDLRRQDPGIDAQLEEVKRLLLVGLSDQGAGLPADAVETDAVGLAISPAGEIHYAGLNTGRVWKKDAQGRLRPVAGNGKGSPGNLSPTQAAPGDGASALAAPLHPSAIAFDAQGNLYVGDRFQRRVRRVDATGTIETYAASADWKELKAIAFEPDGSLLVATPHRLDRVKPDGTIGLVAGGEAGAPAAGPASSLRFRGIEGLAVDQQGRIAVLDTSAQIVQIADGTASIIAGTGKSGFSGDGGQAAQAAIAGMGGLATDADGRLYLADLGNRRIRRIENGTISTIAGTGAFGFKGDGGAALQAGMVNPRSVAVGPDGAVYTADVGFVRRIEGGTITTIVGKTEESPQAVPVEEVQLRNPKGLIYDAEAHALIYGELWRLRRWNLATNMVETLASDGLKGTPFGEGADAMGVTLFNFHGLARGADGALYFLADDAGFTRRLFRQQGGKLTAMAGGGDGCDEFSLLLGIDQPATGACIPTMTWPLALDGDRLFYSVYMQSFGLDLVLGFRPGENLKELTRTQGGKRITALAMTPDRKALIIGALGRILRYELETKQTTELAKDTGPDTPDMLGIPAGFAFDAQGRLYYSDYVASRVRRLEMATGEVVTVAGKGGPRLNQDSVDESLSGPWGLAFDKDGHLYIADMGHNQIKKLPADQL